MQGPALVLHERARAGFAAEHPERRSTTRTPASPTPGPYVPDFSQPAYYDRTWENYTPRITWQASDRNKFSFSWDEQPVCRSLHRHGVLQRFAGRRHHAGSGRPWRVQPAARADGPLDRRRSPTGCCSRQGSARPITSGRARRLDPNPTRDLVRVVGHQPGRSSPPGLTPVHADHTFRSQNWYGNKTRATTGTRRPSTSPARTASRSGYQGNHWIDDREHEHQHAASPVHVPGRSSELDHDVREPLPCERARAMQDSLVRAGSVDDQSADAAGRHPLRSIRGAISPRRSSRRAVSSPVRRSRKPTA